jgi:spore germination protein YaaH
MSRARIPCGLALALAGACVLVSAPVTEAGSVCANKAPTTLSFKREVGKRHGRLSWHAQRGARGRFRVFRDGEVVGQTLGRSLRVAVTPGRSYVFSVRPVSASGSVSECAGELRRAVGWFPPSRVRHVSVRRVHKLRATLSWSRVRRGDGRLAGYRVYRDGQVYRQSRRRSIRVAVTPGIHQFVVLAADTRGRMGLPSRTVRVRVRHSAPGVPRGMRVGSVTDTSVQLGWGPSRKRSSPIVGYRIFRDGQPVRQVRGRAATMITLAPATGYRFTVAAVDRWGYIGPSVATQITTAMPPPTQGSLHAFLLATTDESFADLRRHYRQIGVLYPTYYQCRRSDGAMLGVEDPLVTRWAQMRKILVMPRFDCQSPTTLNKILRDPAVREATLTGLVARVQQYGYDGINIDFEAGYAEDRPALTSFIAELASRLHALGKKVTVEASAKFNDTSVGRGGFYNYHALGTFADWVFVMAWGWHWTTSAPGSPDEIANVIKVADYTATMANKSKFVLGSPLYAQDWPAGGGPSHPSVPIEHGDLVEIVARYGATPRLDATTNTWTFNYTDAQGVPHEVWYGDATTLATRMTIAKQRGLGLGFWRLGREDQRIWDNPLVAPGATWP